jgi:hypothetical protein
MFSDSVGKFNDRNKVSNAETEAHCQCTTARQTTGYKC